MRIPLMADSNSSALKNPRNPHEHWFSGVSSDGRFSQFDFHEGFFSGSSVVMFACPATDDFFRSVSVRQSHLEPERDTKCVFHAMADTIPC